MDQDRIGILLAKYLAGELLPEEQEELEWAFQANPRLRDDWNIIRGLREIPPGDLSAGEEQDMLEKGLRRFKVPDRSRRIPLYRWVAAASLLVLILTGASIYLKHKRRADIPVNPREVATKYGTRSIIDLPDGSRLWLNAGSKVQYADGFPGDKREVTLTGEAFFDIKQDPAHPFILHAGKLDVKVLGTSFNVKAYPDDSTIETTLITGKVEIDIGKDASSKIILQPNEKVIIQTTDIAGNPGIAHPGLLKREQEKFSRHTVAPDSIYRTIMETSWVEDKLAFRNETFEEVARRLERWYNIKLRFENDKYQQYRLTGLFKDQPIKNVMDGLQLILGFHYKISEDTIRIW